MILKHGKFYQDGSEVPPEFGNREQIRLLEATKSGREYQIVDDIGNYQCPGCSADNQIQEGKNVCQCYFCGLSFEFDGEILKII